MSKTEIDQDPKTKRDQKKDGATSGKQDKRLVFFLYQIRFDIMKRSDFENEWLDYTLKFGGIYRLHNYLKKKKISAY